MGSQCPQNNNISLGSLLSSVFIFKQDFILHSWQHFKGWSLYLCFILYFLKLEIEDRNVGNHEQREERHLALLYLCFMGGYHFIRATVKSKIWKIVAERLDAGFLASRGDEFNPEPETRLYRSELLCNKVLLKYKGDRESFWHRHQKGAKEYPVC